MVKFPSWPNLGDKAKKPEEKLLPSATKAIEVENVPESPVRPPKVPEGPSIPISVIAATGAGPGERRVPFVEGQPLGSYLKLEKLFALGLRYAIYDRTYMEKGRCRMNYVPQKDSSILICPPAYNVFSHLTKSNSRPTKKLEEMSFEYKKEKPAVEKERGLFEELDQI